MIISHYAQNVTLSSMSHLVYIPLLGETEGDIIKVRAVTVSPSRELPRGEPTPTGRAGQGEPESRAGYTPPLGFEGLVHFPTFSWRARGRAGERVSLGLCEGFVRIV